MYLPEEDKNYASRNEMLGELVSLLGGRVAEAVVLDDISTGASNDIERATAIARNMVTHYGMSEKIGPVSYTSGDKEVFLGRDYGSARNYSEKVAADIDAEIKEIITNAYNKCENILRTHQDKLTVVAEYLFENEKADRKTFEALMDGTYVKPQTEVEVVPVTETEATETPDEITEE